MYSFIGLQFLPAPARSNQIDTTENEDNSHALDEIERVHTPANGNNAGNKWLDIVVHARHGGTEILLSDHNQHVADEGSPHDNKGQATQFRKMQAAPVRTHQAVGRKWQDAYERVGEHPLHNGHQRIFVHEILI